MQKVQYFWNGRGQQFSYQNKEFHIPKARRRHSGSYFCRGMIGTLNVSSQPVNVTVEGEDVQAGGARGPRCHAATGEEAPDCHLASSHGGVTAGAGATCPSLPHSSRTPVSRVVAGGQPGGRAQHLGDWAKPLRVPEPRCPVLGARHWAKCLFARASWDGPKDSSRWHGGMGSTASTLQIRSLRGSKGGNRFAPEVTPKAQTGPLNHKVK